VDYFPNKRALLYSRSPSTTILQAFVKPQPSERQKEFLLSFSATSGRSMTKLRT
jgi:hypothetical protein